MIDPKQWFLNLSNLSYNSTTTVFFVYQTCMLIQNLKIYVKTYHLSIRAMKEIMFPKLNITFGMSKIIPEANIVCHIWLHPLSDPYSIDLKLSLLAKLISVPWQYNWSVFPTLHHYWKTNWLAPSCLHRIWQVHLSLQWSQQSIWTESLSWIRINQQIYKSHKLISCYSVYKWSKATS